MNDYKFLTEDGFLQYYKPLIPFCRALIPSDKGKRIIKIGYIISETGVLDFSYTDKWFTVKNVVIDHFNITVSITILDTSTRIIKTFSLAQPQFLRGWVVLSDLPTELMAEFYPNNTGGYPENGSILKNDIEVRSYIEYESRINIYKNRKIN